MNRFNLTFSGEILADEDPAQVKHRFGKMFAIDDPEKLESFFSGQIVILRRNLERKAAAQYYHELHQLGVVATLVKVTANEFAEALAGEASQPDSKAIAQTWAVSSSVARRKSQGNKVRVATSEKLQKSSRKSRRDTPDIAAGIVNREEGPTEPAEQETTQATAEPAVQQRQELHEHASQQVRAVEKQRPAETENARREAEKERKAREKAERTLKKAEKAARQRAQREEKKRRHAENDARRRAELAKKKQQEAAETARQKAEIKEQQDREIEEAARLKAEREERKRQQAEQAIRLQAERDLIRRREEEEAARIKAEAERKSAERRQARASKLAAQRAQRENKQHSITAPQEAKNFPAMQTPTPGSATGPVSTNPDTALRDNTEIALPGLPVPHRDRSGQPNFYSLRPFRNTNEVRARAEQAGRRKRRSYTLGTIALAVLLVAGTSFFRQTSGSIITGASAIAIDPGSGPLLLAGESLLLHDRAGFSTQEVSLHALNLLALEAPLAFDSNGALVAVGQLAIESPDSSDSTRQLLRCDLPTTECLAFAPDLKDSHIDALVIHPLDDSLMLADANTGELLKVNRQGEIVARATVALPAHPVLRLHAGLLLINSAEGPGISIFRYEDSAFGKQLDEILLLPPAAQKAEQSAVGDFLWSGDAWWVSLRNPETASIGLYRFDSEWNYLNAVALPLAAGPLQLASWGQKTLVNDPRSAAIQRFNAQGAIEAPFVSSRLEELIARQQRLASLTNSAWHGGLLVCGLVAVLGLGLGYLQGLRQLVYKTRREQGAEPIDAYAYALQWISPLQNRPAVLRRRSISYAVLVVGILLLAVAQSVTAWELAALLLALGGPAIALLLITRRSIGYIGTLNDRLLLVDHDGIYHLAGGSRVQYHGPFLAIDDVVVFTGSLLLPAFSHQQIQEQIRPLALGGVKVDRDTILVKLLQSHHPIAQGALAIVATVLAAISLLCVQGVF